jgi:hypothetical protein
MEVLLWLFVALFVKHFIADFPMQKPYQYLNKGEYGHPGGLFHALNHASLTLIVFSYFTGETFFSLVLAGIDFVAHYHIDWAKVQITKRFGWGPTTHEEYWWLMGFDQLLHALTYIGLIALAVL